MNEDIRDAARQDMAAWLRERQEKTSEHAYVTGTEAFAEVSTGCMQDAVTAHVGGAILIKNGAGTWALVPSYHRMH